MPTISEMREQSRICMQATKDAADAHLRARLGTRALVNALLAEIENEKDEAKKHEKAAAPGLTAGAGDG
jgi:hypothetical protein